MPRFPIQVVAKSRTPEDHLKYYRWVRFVKEGYDRNYVWHEDTTLGWRTRWFHTFMDLVPKVIWRRLPVSWQSAHLFGDALED